MPCQKCVGNELKPALRTRISRASSLIEKKMHRLQNMDLSDIDLVSQRPFEIPTHFGINSIPK